MSRSGVAAWTNQARSLDTRPLLILTAIFLASRLIFFAFGVRFDVSPLSDFWQILDPRLLEEDLLRSVFYLHSQPPLFNLFLGLVLKISPVTPAVAFHGLYMIAGLLCHLATFWLMRLLSIGRVTAGVISTLLVIRPSFILFENWLLYDVPVTLLTCLAGVWLALFARRGSAFYAHAFFATLLLLCATRSLFHAVYFGAVLALLAGMSRGRKRRVLIRSAAAPLLLLTLIYVKNFLVFGHAGPSTWLGMNLARIATAALSLDELSHLHQQGNVSAVATVPPFSPLRLYSREHVAPPRYPEVPALADRVKSTGSINYNHEAYISISNAYLKDSLWIIRHRPGVYLHGVAKACYNYFKPQTEITHINANSDHLRGYVAVSSWLLYGRLPFTFDYRGEEKPIYLFSALGVPLLILFALYLSLRGTDISSRLVLAFMALTVIYVALVGNSLEVWENQRFRFYTDPYFAVFAALAVDRSIRRLEQSTSGSR